MTKLQVAKVIEFHDVTPAFTRPFVQYMIVELSDPKTRISSLPDWRDSLSRYDKALVLLTAEEISDMLELMLFDFTADASRILTIIDEADHKASAD